MTLSRALVAAALLSLPLSSLVASPARADVPPDPDSADAHCTPPQQCPDGVFCPYSFRPGAPADPDTPPVGAACRSEATGRGLERRCRNGGNYGGNDLFCAKGATGSWKSKAKGGAKGCVVDAGDGTDRVTLLAALLLSIGLVATRRAPAGRPAARRWWRRHR